LCGKDLLVTSGHRHHAEPPLQESSCSATLAQDEGSIIVRDLHGVNLGHVPNVSMP
jgi:hypothetical protein